MKAITVWQPWASAIVAGPKRIENRGWAPPQALIGRRIAIHAGKTLDEEASEYLRAWVLAYPKWSHDPGALPRGAIIGSATLAGVVRPHHPEDIARLVPSERVRDVSAWWASDSYGWVLVHPSACAPIPFRGAQGLWDVPEEIARLLEASRPAEVRS